MTDSRLTDRWRPEFPGLERSTYLNTCSLGQLSRRSYENMHQFMELWQSYGASAWYEIWLGAMAEARGRFARLIGAEVHEIALLPSVGVALSVIGGSLDYTTRNEVVVSEMDFPTLPYQWMAREGEGALVRLLSSPDQIHVPIDSFRNAVTSQTALIATTHVLFTSGWVQDITELASIAHEQGALCLIDGYQAAGQIPVDVKASNVDVYISGGLKWLLGGPGIVFMYVRESLIEKLEPVTTGWFAARDMFHFNPERFDRADDARRFEPGTPAVAAVYAANGGMSILEEIGVKNVQTRTDQLVDHLVSTLRQANLSPRIPTNRGRHAGIVMLPVADPPRVVTELKKRGIIIDYRPGALRLSPYFYNREEENEVLVESLCEILASAPA